MARRLPALALTASLALLLAAPAGAQYFAFGKNRVHYDAPDWRYLQSEHFDVYFYERDHAPGSGEVLAAYTADAAEEAYDEVAALFNYDLARRVALLVYPSHNDFAVTNAVQLPDYAEGIGGVTELYKNRIAIPFTGDWRDFRRVIHHELVHAVVNDVFYGGSVQSLLQRGLRFPIPLWFNEGLAEYSAQGWDTNSDMYVRDAVLEDNLAPIPRLNGYFAYRGGQGVWDFVAEEYGREKVTEILERVRLQRSVSGAIRRSTGLSLAELSERWHRALKAVYYPEVAAREAIRDIARPVATREVGGAGYHASPVISPQGDRVAYIATRDGLFDVYVSETAGDPRLRKILDGQDNTQFESLRILTPGLAWSPDGRRLAVAVKSGATDAIALVDVETGRAEHVRPTGVDAVRSVAWSPDGGRIAFSGTAGAHSDLWIVDIASGETTNLTRDLYADHAPAWTPDGQHLVFHSDRGADLVPAATTAQNVRQREFDARALGRAAFDLYRISASASPDRIERLTDDPVWDQTHARVAQVPRDTTGAYRVLYLSDENGVPNLYALEENTRAGGVASSACVNSADIALAASPAEPTGLAELLPTATRPPAKGSSLSGQEGLGVVDPSVQHRGDSFTGQAGGASSPSAPPARLGSESTTPVPSCPGGGLLPTDRAETASPSAVYDRQPLTNIQTGITDLSVSADGSRVTVLALDRGTPSVYLFRDPLSRTDLPRDLAPTVWAQRRLGTSRGTPPSLLIAAQANRERNPLLRDASDGAPPTPPARRAGAPPLIDLDDLTEEELNRAGVPFGTDLDSLVAAIMEERGRPPPNLLASADSLNMATVGFEDYIFTDAFEQAARERFQTAEDAFAPQANRNPDGSYRVQRYKLRFSPDIVYAAGAYDTVFGVQSVTQMLFSDVVGNHRLALATNLVLDLRNSDYLLSYANLRGRTDWGVRAFHLARELPDFRDATVYRYRNYGLVAEASYPLDKFRRIDAEVAVLGVSLADLRDVGTRPSTRTFALPRITYTRDGTVPGFLGPRSGSRYAASLSGSPGPEVYFGTALLDARRYWSLGPGYALAARMSAGASLGPDPQRFYASGVQNWLNPTFRSLPVRNPDDFVFATPVLPLRGFGYSEADGDRFALVNLEARVPLIAAILPGPVPLVPLYNIQTVGFVDAGVIAQGGLDVWREVEAETDPETGAVLSPAREELDDILLGTGVGLRTLLLGYPVRVDWAWPFDGREFGDARVYFSVGLDF